MKRQKDKYKKLKLKLLKQSESIYNTPQTKTNSMIRYVTVPPSVRNALLFHHSLKNQMKSKHKMHNSQLLKQQKVKFLLTGRILKKYKLLKLAKPIIGVTKYMGKPTSIL